MSTAIKVENLSKKYVIGHQREERYTALRDVLMHKLRGVGERLRHPLSPNKEETNLEDFWALKNINLEIKQGDRVGIIGRNGAGKSTFLKLLSRITEPTTGRITINGRVASLLEVGTGFHPELTGRENIFLNGAILGMGRVEIKRKFDEIVAFAEVEKFLDTPVKRYSSGMYVRLAFAVAAHLEPEILLVDEVLAVGDAAFQKKCLGKMKNVSEEGKTIFFVSHKMDAIRRLCDHAVLLEKGKLIAHGEKLEIIDQYLASEDLKTTLNDRGPAPHKGMHLRSITLLDKDLISRNHLKRNELCHANIVYDINTPLENVHIVCHIVDIEDRIIVSTGDCDVNRELYLERAPGSYMTNFRLPTNILNEGEYTLIFALGVPYGHVYDRLTDTVGFSISESREKSGPAYVQRRPGFVIQDILWTTTQLDTAYQPLPSSPEKGKYNE